MSIKAPVAYPKDEREFQGWLRKAYEEPLIGDDTPVGTVTPQYIGQEFLNTTGPTWYKSTGLTNTSWVALN